MALRVHLARESQHLAGLSAPAPHHLLAVDVVVGALRLCVKYSFAPFALVLGVMRNMAHSYLVAVELRSIKNNL